MNPKIFDTVHFTMNGVVGEPVIPVSGEQNAKRKRRSGGSFCAVGGCSNRSHRDKTSKIPGRSFIRYREHSNQKFTHSYWYLSRNAKELLEIVCWSLWTANICTTNARRLVIYFLVMKYFSGFIDYLRTKPKDSYGY